MINVEVKGVTELVSKLSTYGRKFEQETSAILEEGAREFVALATEKAKIGKTGFLASSISYTGGGLSFTPAARMSYAPYVEWGTITRVRVPVELQSYAIQFKGRGIRKKGGIYPMPFFFVNTPYVEKQIVKDLNNLINSQKL